MRTCSHFGVLAPGTLCFPRRAYMPLCWNKSSAWPLSRMCQKLFSHGGGNCLFAFYPHCWDAWYWWYWSISTIVGCLAGWMDGFIHSSSAATVTSFGEPLKRSKMCCGPRMIFVIIVQFSRSAVLVLPLQVVARARQDYMPRLCFLPFLLFRKELLPISQKQNQVMPCSIPGQDPKLEKQNKCHLSVLHTFFETTLCNLPHNPG